MHPRSAAATGTCRGGWDALRGRRVLAAAGLARPEAFFVMLEARGLQIDRLPLSDHHGFDPLPWPADTGDLIVTEKDAVKLFARYPQAGLMLLAVPLLFTPEPAFFRALDERLLPLLSTLPSSHGHQTS